MDVLLGAVALRTLVTIKGGNFRLIPPVVSLVLDFIADIGDDRLRRKRKIRKGIIKLVVLDANYPAINAVNKFIASFLLWVNSNHCRNRLMNLNG
jgi:hypothetical protein